MIIPMAKTKKKLFKEGKNQRISDIYRVGINNQLIEKE